MLSVVVVVYLSIVITDQPVSPKYMAPQEQVIVHRFFEMKGMK